MNKNPNLRQNTAQKLTNGFSGGHNVLPSDTYNVKHGGLVYEFYLSGDIKAPEFYVEWFTLIRNADERDQIKIYINSPGGDLHTAIQFLRVLSETQAEITTSVEGACMSAATIIFLCGDIKEVTPFSMFMFHNYSGGSIGKGNEMYDQAIFERNWSLDLFTQIYTGFLTDTEIETMLDGKDVWLTSEKVLERLRKQHTVSERQLDQKQELVDSDEYLEEQ
jgi:ATP-dependent protease ClpP protease subunit